MAKNSHNKSNNQELVKSQNVKSQDLKSRELRKNSTKKSESKPKRESNSNPITVVPKLVLSNGPKDLILTASTRNPIKGFKTTYEKELSIPLDSFGNAARLFSHLVPALNAHFSGSDLFETFKNHKGTKMKTDNKSEIGAEASVTDSQGKAPSGSSVITDEKLRSLVNEYRNADSHSKKVLAGIALTNYQIRLSEISKFKTQVLVAAKSYAQQPFQCNNPEMTAIAEHFCAVFGSLLQSSYSQFVGEPIEVKELLDSYVLPILAKHFEVFRKANGKYAIKQIVKKAKEPSNSEA